MKLHNVLNPHYIWVDLLEDKKNVGAKNRKQQRQLRKILARKARRFINNKNNW